MKITADYDNITIEGNAFIIGINTDKFQAEMYVSDGNDLTAVDLRNLAKAANFAADLLASEITIQVNTSC